DLSRHLSLADYALRQPFDLDEAGAAAAPLAGKKPREVLGAKAPPANAAARRFQQLLQRRAAEQPQTPRWRSPARAVQRPGQAAAGVLGPAVRPALRRPVLERGRRAAYPRAGRGGAGAGAAVAGGNARFRRAGPLRR